MTQEKKEKEEMPVGLHFFLQYNNVKVAATIRAAMAKVVNSGADGVAVGVGESVECEDDEEDEELEEEELEEVAVGVGVASAAKVAEIVVAAVMF